MFDRPIAFHREFVVLTGSITAALFLSQAVYWTKRTKEPDGWFYKSRAEWQEETGMSRREQETARKKLKALGIIREDRRGGMNPTTYFWVDTDRLEVMVKTAYQNRVSIADGGKRPQVMAESAHSNGTNPPSDIKDTEITSESDLPEQVDPDEEDGITIGKKVRILTNCFQGWYEKHFGKKPDWSKADFAQAKRQIKRVGNVMEVVLCVREAWRSKDPHFRKIRTSFKSLMADNSIDQLLAIVRGDRLETESIDQLEEAQEKAYGKG